MKKIAIGLALVLVIAVAISAVFVNQLDSRIANIIRTEGSAALGAKVDVRSVETKLKDGSATITGLTIANPAGYQAANALSITNFIADVDYQSQTIKKIVIDKPIVNAEVIDVKKNNFQGLLDAMPNSKASATNNGNKDKEQLKLRINELQLNRAQVNLSNEEIGQHSFAMSNFVMRNLSGTVDELSNKIISELTDHVSNEISSYVKKELTNLAKEKAKQEVKDALNKKIEEELDDDLKNKLKSLKLEIR